MMGEYKAWVERDLPADGWNIWIYRRLAPGKIEMIYPGSNSTYRLATLDADVTSEQFTEPSLWIPYCAGESLLEALASAVKPLTLREDPYVKCLLERIADLKAHVKDLREVCEIGLYDAKFTKADVEGKLDIVLDPDLSLPGEGVLRDSGKKVRRNA